MRATTRSLPARTAVAAAGLSLAAAASGALTLAPAASAGSSPASEFLSHLNNLRAAHHLQQLSMTADLVNIATGHSRLMASRHTIFHNGSLAQVASNWRVLGENVGMGPSVASLDYAFDHSPEHYANEVNPAYSQVGIAVTRDSAGELYVTLDFRAPMYAAARRSVRPASRAVGRGAAMPMIYLGSRGGAVAVAQRQLHVSADGDFGPITRGAVLRFQRSHRLAADGVVGPVTWRALGH